MSKIQVHKERLETGIILIERVAEFNSVYPLLWSGNIFIPDRQLFIQSLHFMLGVINPYF